MTFAVDTIVLPLRLFAESADRLYRRGAMANLARSRLLAAADARTELCFLTGLAVVLLIAFAMWRGFWPYAATAMKSYDTSVTEKHAYGCRTPDCGRCLSEVDAHRDGIVFTAGSGAAYGFDLDLIKKSSRRPIVDCIMYGTWLDGFPLILNQRNRLSSTQLLLHAVNSWVMVDGGHLAQYEINGPNPYIHPPEFVEPSSPSAASKAHLFFILLNRHFSEYQVRPRRELYGSLRAISTWPLTLSAHLRLKEQLMQRHIKISPWAVSFLQKVDTVPSLEQLRARIGRISNHLGPVERMVFFTMPEYTPITQAQRAAIFAESQKRFLAVLKEFNIEYIEVDYSACGLGRQDFWAESVYVIDPVHLPPRSQQKTTDCMLQALAKHDVF